MSYCPSETELDRARRRLSEIKAKYTRPDEQQYLALLVGAWRYHIKVLEDEIQRDPKRSA